MKDDNEGGGEGGDDDGSEGGDDDCSEGSDECDLKLFEGFIFNLSPFFHQFCCVYWIF